MPSVYVLSNEAMPGLVKIGYTDRTADKRVKELVTTGVPCAFTIELEIIVDNARRLEKSLHERFRKHRYNREFFKLTANDAALGIAKFVQETDFNISAITGRMEHLMPGADERLAIRNAIAEEKENKRKALVALNENYRDKLLDERTTHSTWLQKRQDDRRARKAAAAAREQELWLEETRRKAQLKRDEELQHKLAVHNARIAKRRQRTEALVERYAMKLRIDAWDNGLKPLEQWLLVVVISCIVTLGAENIVHDVISDTLYASLTQLVLTILPISIAVRGFRDLSCDAKSYLISLCGEITGRECASDL